jgi:hypothetical protein
MSWQIFKDNILRYANNPDSIKDIDTVAKLYATEYDAAIRRGSDTINHVSIKKGNVDSMQSLFKIALLAGQSTNGPYDLVGAMGNGVIAYWTGATLNEFPIPIIPAAGSIQNIGVTSNVVVNPGVWQPPILTVSVPIIDTTEPTTEELLAKLPNDNNTVEGAQEVVSETGAEILTDGGEEGGEQIEGIKEQLPEDNPPYEELSESEAENLAEQEPSSKEPISKKEPYSVKCNSGVDYDSKISPSYRLRDLSIGCVFAHKIKAQVGLTEDNIVCNLQNVAQNILEPLKAQYPNVRVNSGFRGTASIPGGVSQHQKGEAVDVQFIGVSPKEYIPIANWVKANLPFDQLIFEHGNSIWLHISCKKDATQRKQLLTMKNGKYESGLKCYYV